MNYIRLALLLLFQISTICWSFGQENYKTVTTEDSLKTHYGGTFYPVDIYEDNFENESPKNVILMIGDGMGIAQVFAGMTANGNHLFLENFKNIGFSKTQSRSDYVTDSAAGGTALACGRKTYNGAIGVDADTVAIQNIREYAESLGMATGVVSTSAITHATPASFVAHLSQRTLYEDIAADFLKTNIDVFIGGGYKHFAEREDGKNLVDTLVLKGYQVVQNMDSILKISDGKLAGLTAYEHNEKYSERGDMLPQATQTALNILDNNKDGFFLMVEGSQIDWGGHQNNTRYLVEEMLDFDRAIGVALEFAARDKNTLIVVTADHETGGFSIMDGDMKKGMVKGAFSTGHHSGVVVPVFAFGPGAQNFIGFMENSEIEPKIKQLLTSDNQ